MFNHVGRLSETRPGPTPLEDRPVSFLARDDEAAKAIVSDLTEAIGVAPVDTGPSLRGPDRNREHRCTTGR